MGVFYFCLQSVLLIQLKPHVSVTGVVSAIAASHLISGDIKVIAVFMHFFMTILQAFESSSIANKIPMTR